MVEMPEYWSSEGSEELNKHNDSLQPGQVGRCRVEPHGWGNESWIVNGNLYCSKLLYVNPGKQCSIHMHIKKTEHFCLLSGAIQLSLIHKDGEKQIVNMKPGDIVLITPGLFHSFYCPDTEEKQAIILEASTRHYESDSYRVARGD